MLSRTQVTQMALNLGFDLVGFAPAGPTPGAQAFLDWLSAGFHGEMHYLAREPAKRLDPQLVLPGVRTVMVVGASYDTLSVPQDVLHDPSRGRIARYAWGADYHDVLTPRLRELGEQLAQVSRAYVDTGPVLERAWAQAAGLGFIGRNTCLINWSRGSFLFLGAVLLGEEILDFGLPIADSPSLASRSQPAGVESNPLLNTTEALIQNRQSKIQNLKSPCGGCTRCLNACPTQAFRGPGVLDARRCISYLTIELKGAIPVELRPQMGNWLFGLRRVSGRLPLRAAILQSHTLCSVLPARRRPCRTAADGSAQPGPAGLQRTVQRHAPPARQTARRLAECLYRSRQLGQPPGIAALRTTPPR